MVILHGLYGSSDNWAGIAKFLSEKFDVIVPDQRNHGQSPHSNEHSYELMVSDLLGLLNKLNVRKTILIGHSMGGKTAMQFALNYPERISQLIILDISPRSYTGKNETNFNFHRTILHTMDNAPIDRFNSRQDAEKYFDTYISDPATRLFILKNLKRNKDNSFKWGLNVKTIQENLEKMLEGMNDNHESDSVTGFPVLFIKGENSDYITQQDYPLIKKLFPAADFQTIKNAGHWLHAEQPEMLIGLINNFLNNDTPSKQID